jgi:two-component system nitrate/nitrite response regulator NarL
VRVVLIGDARARQRLRAQLADVVEIAGESPSLDAARVAGVEADAWLVAPDPVVAQDDEDVHVEPLTPRESDVLELLVQGLSNRAIAATLGISDQTVKFHVAAICGKLGAPNRTGAVREALRRGLLPL